MSAVISAGLIMNRQEEEIRKTLECLDHASSEISVYLCDLFPEEITSENLQWNFPGLTILSRKPGEKATVSHNLLLPYLGSTYHLIMDPGITFPPVMIEHMVSYMNGHPNIAILAPQITNHNGLEIHYPKKKLSIRGLLGLAFGGHGGIFRSWRNSMTMEDLQIPAPISVHTASLSCMLIRTSVLKELGGFDFRYNRYLADHELCARITERRLGSIVFHPDMKMVRTSDTVPAESFFSKILALFRYSSRHRLNW